MTESKLKPMRAMQFSSPGWQKRKRKDKKGWQQEVRVRQRASAMSGMRWINVKQASRGSGRRELSEDGSAHAKKRKTKPTNRRKKGGKKEGREGER